MSLVLLRPFMMIKEGIPNKYFKNDCARSGIQCFVRWFVPFAQLANNVPKKPHPLVHMVGSLPCWVDMILWCLFETVSVV